MTGWRTGYAVWPDSMVDPVTRLCINDHSCVNAAAQFAGLAALTGPKDAVDEMVRQFDSRRRVIIEALNDLPGVRCADAAGAFYAFPNISDTGLSANEAQALCGDQAGGATGAGSRFGAHGGGCVHCCHDALQLHARACSSGSARRLRPRLVAGARHLQASAATCRSVVSLDA